MDYCREDFNYDFNERNNRRGGKPQDVEIATENLLLMKEILNKYDIEFWLMFGTLLGAIRDKDFIKHDTDTDIGGFYRDNEKLLAAIPDMVSKGFTPIRAKTSIGAYIFIRKDEYIDIYLYRLVKNHMNINVWNCWNYEIPETYFKEFNHIQFLNTIFTVPSNSDLLLEEWYGKDWQEPKIDTHAQINKVIKQSIISKLFRWFKNFVLISRRSN